VIEWVAAVHVHTRYSDGAGSVPEIIDAARDAGADAVVTADHDNASAIREHGEGWRSGTLLVSAVEVTPWRQPHCLALGARHCCGFSQMSEAGCLAAIDAQGAFAIVSHPEELRWRSVGIHHAPWRLWSHPTVRGFELWSYMHDWASALKRRWFWRPWDLWRRPDRYVQGPGPGLLAAWDQTCRVRRLSAVSGLDCHGRRIPVLDVVIFPYEMMFRTVRTHLFVHDADGTNADAARAREAMAEGRCFVAWDGLADARGLAAEAETSDGQGLAMGEETPFSGPTRLRLDLPCEAEVTALCDGSPCLEAIGRIVEFVAKRPGAYRFEARRGGRPWVFTNPFYLRPAAPRLA
jgi:hypothetical protein